MNQCLALAFQHFNHVCFDFHEYLSYFFNQIFSHYLCSDCKLQLVTLGVALILPYPSGHLGRLFHLAVVVGSDLQMWFCILFCSNLHSWSNLENAQPLVKPGGPDFWVHQFLLRGRSTSCPRASASPWNHGCWSAWRVQKPRRWSLNRVGHPPRFDGNFMGFNGDDTISHTHIYIYTYIHIYIYTHIYIYISGYTKGIDPRVL